MTALTFSDFRKNMASSFDLVDAGEHVFINRGSKKMYAIVAVDDDDLTITPAMAAKIEKEDIIRVLGCRELDKNNSQMYTV